MTQEAALAIIKQASRNKHIIAELDTQRARSGPRSASYRVRLVLKPERRVFVIADQRDWPPIRQAWRQLLTA